MAVLFTPRKWKQFRLHKTIAIGTRERKIIPQGSIAAVHAKHYGNLNWRKLEAGRRFLTRQLRRAKVKLKVRLTQPITSKSKQARMGKGKGKFKGWVGYTRPGTLLYEIGPTSKNTWQEHKKSFTRLSGHFPFESIQHKFSFKINISRCILSLQRNKNPYRKAKLLGYQINNRSRIKYRISKEKIINKNICIKKQHTSIKNISNSKKRNTFKVKHRLGYFLGRSWTLKKWRYIIIVFIKKLWIIQNRITGSYNKNSSHKWLQSVCYPLVQLIKFIQIYSFINNKTKKIFDFNHSQENINNIFVIGPEVKNNEETVTVQEFSSGNFFQQIKHKYIPNANWDNFKVKTVNENKNNLNMMSQATETNKQLQEIEPIELLKKIPLTFIPHKKLIKLPFFNYYFVKNLFKQIKSNKTFVKNKSFKKFMLSRQFLAIKYGKWFYRWLSSEPPKLELQVWPANYQIEEDNEDTFQKKNSFSPIVILVCWNLKSAKETKTSFSISTDKKKNKMERLNKIIFNDRIKHALRKQGFFSIEKKKKLLIGLTKKGPFFTGFQLKKILYWIQRWIRLSKRRRQLRVNSYIKWLKRQRRKKRRKRRRRTYWYLKKKQRFWKKNLRSKKQFQ